MSNSNWKPEFRNSEIAFNEAIEAGALSLSPEAPNYAGNYMYMFTEELRGDAFKNIYTRNYIYMGKKSAQ